MKETIRQDNQSVFIIVPVHNEGKVIRKTLEPLLEQGYTVVAVDDGSTDDTLGQLQGLKIHILKHPLNLGQGAALQTGFEYALRKGAQYVVTFDGDGQHRCCDIESLLKLLRGGTVDVALGSRFLLKSHAREIPFRRRVLLLGARIVNCLLTGVWLSDAHNGLRALTAEAVAKIRLTENGFAHASEIIFQIKQLKLHYVEVPTKVRYSQYSRAKGQSAWNAFNIVIDLLLRRVFK
ncbi:glycosyltransferase family 2 protein [Omnitrophica bacterium]|nr:glycosyltransferase family 2 protein [Candidatus Omnitrophota bacterium]